MQLRLERLKFNKGCTIGKLYIDNVFFAHVLEDRVRDLGPDGSGKVPKETAIPEGTYTVILSVSTRFKRLMPLILNVPFFTGVRIHGGNTAADTEGCPVIGAHSDGVSKVWDCKDKVNALIAAIEKAGGKCTLQVVNLPVAAPMAA